MAGTGKIRPYSHVNMPNQNACAFANSNQNWPSNWNYASGTLVGASSHHPGGVNICLLDGSVRFVKDTINQTTWWALATEAGGEVISADQL